MTNDGDNDGDRRDVSPFNDGNDGDRRTTVPQTNDGNDGNDGDRRDVSPFGRAGTVASSDACRLAGWVSVRASPASSGAKQIDPQPNRQIVPSCDSEVRAQFRTITAFEDCGIKRDCASQ